MYFITMLPPFQPRPRLHHGAAARPVALLQDSAERGQQRAQQR